MARLQGRPEAVSAQVDSVRFAFYTDAEVRRISVRQITSPVLFDNFKIAVKGGLYDPALGPVEQNVKCPTCGENTFQCPGHFGHISLILPVYNPMVFKMLVKTLRCICIYCHHFRMKKKDVAAFAKKLALVAIGCMVEAMAIRTQNKQKDEEGKQEDEEGNGGVQEIEMLDDSGAMSYAEEAELSKPEGEGELHLTSVQVSALKDIIKQFFDAMPKQKCANCDANVPGFKPEGVGKIFQIPLTKSRLYANLSKHKVFDPKTFLRGITVKGDSPEEEELEGEDELGEDLRLSDGKKRKNGHGMSGPVEVIKKALKGKTAAYAINPKDLEQRSEPRFLTSMEVREHMRLLWEREAQICSLIWGIDQFRESTAASPGSTNSSSMFFLQEILVTPNRFRPPNKMDEDLLEHPQNVFYSRVVQANMALTEAARNPKVDLSKTTQLWLNLQNSVNALLDSSTAGKQTADMGAGVRQLLEKKEGLFRMNMMGKRVNYACRSVISPDPYIAVNEIGIPPYFATRLTYPERVTPWNAQVMRKAVENGANAHPGATHIEDEQGNVTSLDRLPKFKRIALAKTLLSTPGAATSSTPGGSHAEITNGGKAAGKIVYRHLRDGDILLVNRQPTLHKPGVMAHRARVLKGEKTLRLHYANCSTYNADFDGDEMNVHFPQEEKGRAEGYYIVNADQQYVVPTSGSPLRGLIQDHIVSATLLTKRDTFFTKQDYNQLVYAACVSSAPAQFLKQKGVVGIVERDRTIRSLPPAVLKPQPLWTGKQVITTVLNYITTGTRPFSLKAAGKVSGDYWGKTSGELEVLISNNELLCGVIDKAQFGQYGLVHTFQELYGPEATGRLLSMFSRLFTSYLQMHGFTCGVSDLLLMPHGEQERSMKLQKADELGDDVHSRFVGRESDSIESETLKLEVEKILQTKGDAGRARLDMLMTSALNRITSDVNNSLFPRQLLKPFLSNWLALMTVTGAKGGLVNFTQISSLLGQQELEGKRVPRMASGKPLPTFSPWDTGARAGGFISDRFLTGLRPQEYYFHCMAGRDGLVDTAVKTSRSGYLQRCLVKNLESLKVHYDYTVRDSDNSIIQFRYGEDGVDVTKSGFVKQFERLAINQDLVATRLGRDDLLQSSLEKSSKKKNRRSGKVDTQNSDPLESVSEAYKQALDDFIARVDSSSRRERKHLQLRHTNQKENFKKLMEMKYVSSLANPGEPVGVVAAQSVGEPSTQMTLNTFHFAGRGEMNVTLGIPRLREILMTASKEISTPIMTCPLRAGKTRDDAERIAMQLRKLRLIDLVERVEVSEVPFWVHNGVAHKVYQVKLHLYPPERFPSYLNLGLEECERVVRDQFSPRLSKEMTRAFGAPGKRNEAVQITTVSQSEGSKEEPPGDSEGPDNGKPGAKKKGQDDEEEDDEDEDTDEEGADAEKRRCQGTDERGYDDMQDEDEEAIAKKSLEGDETTIEDGQEEEKEEEGQGKMPRKGEEDEVDQGQGKRDRKGNGGTAESDSDADDPEAESSGRSTVNQAYVKPASTGGVGKGRKKKESDVENSFSAKGSTFEIRYTVNKQHPPIMLAEIVEKVARQVTVRSVSGIERCAVIDYKGDPNTPALQADGVNFEGLWAFEEELDINRLTTNSIGAMLQVYGVEAARATILSEVQAVFGLYGIAVDSRHLGLIADFMTFGGGFRGCNRIGIQSSPSPFLKMSFETATSFLMDATLQQETDTLESPSARIVMGRVVQSGTGSFDLLQQVDGMIKSYC